MEEVNNHPRAFEFTPIKSDEPGVQAWSISEGPEYYKRNSLIDPKTQEVLNNILDRVVAVGRKQQKNKS